MRNNLNKIKHLFLLFIYMLLCGCSEGSNPLTPNFEVSFLNVHSEGNLDENGYYHLEYDGLSYDRVSYQTSPHERVFWGSVNDFDVEWMGEIFTTPIINFSTYANNLGEGQQMFYIDQTMIGDTLQIFGYVDTFIWDEILIILEDNE